MEDDFREDKRPAKIKANKRKIFYMFAAANKNLLMLTVSAALIGGSLTGCNKTKDAASLISDAKNYQQKGDDKAAIIQFKNALQQNPDDREARYLLGTIYNKTGDFQSAEKELRKALSLGMSPAAVMPALGITLLSLGQFQQILDETDQLSEDKNSPEILTLRGNALLALGKAEKAKSMFEQAIAVKPGFSDALIGLGRYSLSKRDLEAAMRYSQQAVTQSPENADAWFFKADLLRIKNEVDAALAAYDQVLKLKPDSSLARLNKAFMEIGTGKFDFAKTDIDAARKAAPGGVMVFYAQALLDYAQGKHAAALESLQQILSKVPEHMPSLLLAGAVQFSLGSSIQAEQHLKHYLEKDPKNIYARKLFASALLKNERPQQAIDVLAPVLRDTQHDPQLLALAGEAYMQARDFPKATEYFEKASNISPSNALLHTALSMSKLGQGENARAVAELEMATRLDPKSAQAGVLLIMTHLRLKEFDKALSAAKTLEKEYPDNPLIQNLKGGIYMGKKDIPNARASFEKALSLQPTYFPAAMNLAQIDLQEKRPDAAKKRFEAILEKDKKNIQAMSALSNIALNQRHIKEATDWLERASQENPDALQPAMLLTAHYLRLGEKQKSLTLAKKLQGLHPSDPEVLELLGQAQLVNNDQAGALESYSRLAAMRPDSPLPSFQIASIQIANGNPSAASDALKKALAIQPDYQEALLAQIMLEAGKGDYEKALGISRRIQKQHPKSSLGYIAEGDVLMKQKNPALAAKAYEHAFDISKNQLLIVKLHTSLSQSGQIKEANSRLLQWLKDHPADVLTRMYLAGTYMADRQNKAAIGQYQTILKDNPTYVPALNNLAWLYQQQGDPVALEYAEKAHQLAAGEPTVLDTLGWILIEQGNTDRGLPLLQKAVSLAPTAPEIRYHLALGLIKTDDKSRARKELEQLLSTSKNFPNIDDARALLKQMQ